MDAVFPDPAAQGAGVETEKYRGPGFPLDSPAGLPEHLSDMVALHLARGLEVLPGLLAGRRGCLEPVQDPERGALAGDHRPLDDALQLTHVAGPVVLLELIQGLFLHGFELSPDLLVELGDEETDQQRDVFLALPERRDRDGENIETVEQVLPELPLADLFLQVAVGGGDDPHVDFDRAGITQSLELAFLDDPEQPGLQLQGHLADLVEQYGAAPCRLE